ncbi:MAG: DUF2288 domain-containing protein [Abyssibacter sp.]|uniref:DUF2288 domain-containing protein n=1 Tax=Abyssibacter sp. TaxID=2320200 RepID=UPI00321B50AD
MTLEEHQAELATQTAKMPWRELQRFFASGQAIAVATDLDLVEVAARVAMDDKPAVETWVERGAMGPVSDDQAIAWFEADALLWTVVVKPWVLVQPLPDTDASN